MPYCFAEHGSICVFSTDSVLTTTLREALGSAFYRGDCRGKDIAVEWSHVTPLVRAKVGIWIQVVWLRTCANSCSWQPLIVNQQWLVKKNDKNATKIPGRNYGQIINPFRSFNPTTDFEILDIYFNRKGQGSREEGCCSFQEMASSVLFTCSNPSGAISAAQGHVLWHLRAPMPLCPQSLRQDLPLKTQVFNVDVIYPHLYATVPLQLV